jgi:hypothetical protein
VAFAFSFRFFVFPFHVSLHHSVYWAPVHWWAYLSFALSHDKTGWLDMCFLLLFPRSHRIELVSFSSLFQYYHLSFKYGTTFSHNWLSMVFQASVVVICGIFLVCPPHGNIQNPSQHTSSLSVDTPTTCVFIVFSAL